MTATLGTLAPSGIFTPGDVKNEAELLHTATVALGKLVFNHSELFGDDFLTGWNAYVQDEKDFYGRSQSFFYFGDFADNAARDQVLALERRYTDLFAQVNGTISGTIHAGDTSSLPTFSDPATRTPPPLFPITGQAADEALSGVDKLAKQAEGYGWDVIIAAAVVVGLAIAGVVVLVKHAGGRVAVPGLGGIG